ncbi:MAG: glycosyltransferase family 2 protein [Peptostreptococcales bacterium]
MERKKVLIIIPAYNEGKNLPTLLDKLSEERFREIGDILVINDASKDDTREIVHSYGLLMISNIFNIGYGSSLQTGYKYALRQGYEYVIQLDADGQHDVENILKLYEALLTRGCEGKRPDIVVGSRFLEGGKSFQISNSKKIAMRWFSFLIKSSTGKIVTDPTSGLQGLNKEAFSYYSRFSHFDYHYPDANMIIQMLLLGYNVCEVPAVMHERREGTSMHTGLLKPLLYMLTMPLCIWNTIIRIKRGLQK